MENPEEAKPRRESSDARPNPSCGATDSGAEQDPEGGVIHLASSGNRRQDGRPNVTRVTASDELVRLRRRRNPCRVNPGRGSGVK